MMRYGDSTSIYADANGTVGLIAANQASLLRRWTSLGGSGTCTGPTGAQHDSCLQLGNDGGLSLTLDPQSEWIVGFACYYDGPSPTGSANALWNMLVPVSFSGGAPAQMFVLRVNSDLTFSLLTNSVVIDTSLTTMPITTWTYIEFRVSFSGTSNISTSADLWLNATHIAGGTALSGVATSELASFSATTNSHVLRVVASTTGATTLAQDVYIFDANGTANNAPLLVSDPSKFKIIPLWPDAASSKSDWAPNGVGANYTKVFENPEDGDTTYNSSATVTQIDTYQWTPVPGFSGTIPGVQLSTCARKTDEGHGAVQAVVGVIGTEAQSTTFYLGNNYIYYLYEIDVDPATTLPWTQAGFNAKSFGLQVV